MLKELFFTLFRRKLNKNMKVIDIKDRIDDLIYPMFDQIAENLPDDQIDYFIQFMASNTIKSFKEWEKCSR